MHQPDPDGDLALRLEASGRRLARAVCVVAGIGSIFFGIVFALMLTFIRLGAIQVNGNPEDVGLVEVIIGGLTTFLLLIGLPLFFGRGGRLLRTTLPAIIGGLFALVLVRAPSLGLVLPPNGGTMLIVLVLGIVYISVLVSEPANVDTRGFRVVGGRIALATPDRETR